MVQRTNAACGGRESVSAMKGEVVSSILTGSTIPALQLSFQTKRYWSAATGDRLPDDGCRRAEPGRALASSPPDSCASLPHPSPDCSAVPPPLSPSPWAQQQSRPEASIEVPIAETLLQDRK